MKRYETIPVEKIIDLFCEECCAECPVQRKCVTCEESIKEWLYEEVTIKVTRAFIIIQQNTPASSGGEMNAFYCDAGYLVKIMV